MFVSSVEKIGIFVGEILSADYLYKKAGEKCLLIFRLLAPPKFHRRKPKVV